ncbi:MAG: hypothetical protein AAGF06_01655 [Pseudomonadota bacterium]
MHSLKVENAAPSKKATHVLLLIIVSILAALLVYVLITKAPSLKYDTMKRQADKISTLPKEQQAQARKTLLVSIDEQLAADSKKIHTELASLGVLVAQQLNDETSELHYYEYLNAHKTIVKDQSIGYAKILYKQTPDMTPTLREQIDFVLAMEPKQGDMMLIVGDYTLKKQHYYLAVKALNFAVKSLEGDSLTQAEALRISAQKKLDALRKETTQ